MNISNQDRERIKNKIAEVEKITSAEIVPMIIDQSDEYPVAHFRAGVFGAVIASLILYLSPLHFINPIYFLWIQIPGFLIGYLLCYIPFFKRILSTKKERQIEVHQRAMEAFFHHNLHLTTKHNGVLIYFSVLEKRMHIIADNGITKMISNSHFENIINQTTEHLLHEGVVAGMLNTIELSANLLSKYFPQDGTKKDNQLSDALITENK